MAYVDKSFVRFILIPAECALLSSVHIIKTNQNESIAYRCDIKISGNTKIDRKENSKC